MIKEKDQIKAAPFNFRNFIVAESHIKIGSKTKASSVDVGIEPFGKIYEDEKIFELSLIINLKSSDGLSARVKLIGYFEFKDVVNISDLDNYFFVNAPAIMFPYLRSYISALTALSGCATIILPPMNMTAIGKMLQDNIKNIGETE